MIDYFCQLALKEGGRLFPLLVPTEEMVGPSLSNCSIYLSKQNKLYVNIRNLNYVLYHAEHNAYEHQWGPLVYLHKESDWRLITNNILCELNLDTLEIIKSYKIDTSSLDVEPLWEFVGLEDGRLVEWDNKFFISGVRRDTTTNGQGRMELSELVIDSDKTLEISRQRIPAPGKNDSYCEKNWMPILDLDYHYVKWTNPTEVVRYDPVTKECVTTHLTKYQHLNTRDLRGGSQIIRYNNYYLGIVHEVNLFSSETGRKNAIYTHRFVVWDDEWNLKEISEDFSFMGGKVEFSCGLTYINNNFLISFGFQDNAAFIISVPESLIKKMLKIYG
jgi:hypothetical protein